MSAGILTFRKKNNRNEAIRTSLPADLIKITRRTRAETILRGRKDMDLEWMEKAFNDAKKRLFAKEPPDLMLSVEQLSEVLQSCKLSVNDLSDDEENMRSY